MITWKGVRAVPLHQIEHDAAYTAILDSPEARKKGYSIRMTGGRSINPPVLRDLGYERYGIVTGRARLAGHAMLGDTHVMANIVQCSDLEAELLADIEDAERRHDAKERDEKTLRIVDMLSDMRQREGDSPRDARRDARLTVAQQQGIDVESVRKREYRARVRAKLLSEGALKGQVVELETWGLPLSHESALIYRELTDAFRKLRRKGVAARRLARTLEKHPRVRAALVVTLRQLAEDFIDRIDELAPIALCPYCKARREYRKTCAPCDGTGWANASEVDKAPEELTGEGQRDQPAVLHKGELTFLAEQLGDGAL